MSLLEPQHKDLMSLLEPQHTDNASQQSHSSSVLTLHHQHATVLDRKIERVASRRHWLLPASLALLTIIALGIWVASLQTVNLRQMNDFGLISVLPVPALIALALLNVSFCLALAFRPTSSRLPLIHVAILLFMLYGVTAVIEDQPRFESAWRHVGITEYITRQESIDPEIDAYFNWPGAFILNAFITEISGVNSALSFVPWAALFFNLLYLGPLIIIFRSATSDQRVVWLGVWLFYLGNWIGQDYLSPQALNYFLYLVVIGIMLRWFSTPTIPLVLLLQRISHWPRVDRIVKYIPDVTETDDRPILQTTSVQRAGLLIIVVSILGVITSSHQLTPFFMIAGLLAVSPFSRHAVRRLPLIMVILTATWITFMAVTYFSGHFEHVTRDVGAVDQAVGANVADRLQGSPEHVLVVRIRLVMTVAIWGLAVLGGIRRLRQGHLDLGYALLAMAPFPFMILQPYGGELLLRVYLFALAPSVYFVARLFFTSTATRSWLQLGILILLTTTLSMGFLVSRYGNERMDNFTTEEVAAMRYLYSVADPGALIVTGTPNLPWKYRDYELHRHVVLSAEAEWIGMEPSKASDDAVMQLINNYDNDGENVYVIITRSTNARATILGELPPGLLPQLEQVLIRSDKFEVVFANEDATIFVPTETTGASS